MSGLDNIIARIADESAAKAKGILDEAQKKADEIILDSAKKTAEECERINKKTDTLVAGTKEQGETSAELRMKQIMLRGKQDMMTEVIETAKDRLANLSDAEYADFIIKLFEKHKPSRNAVLMLSDRDLKRLGNDTFDKLKKIAEQNGAKLMISDKPADIKDGFILNYGGAEDNCTIEALMEQNMDDLLDKVKDILF